MSAVDFSCLVTITGSDRRRGMGIGGLDMQWTATHEKTGCAVTWRSNGSWPHSQHKLRDHALAVLELLVEPYTTPE